MYGQRMTEKQYREHHAVSRSDLWEFIKSPEKYAYLKQHPKEPTPAMLFGQLFHKMLLLPNDVETEFAVLPDVDKRTKEGRQQYQDFLQSVGEKKIVPPEMLNTATEMCAAFSKSKYANKILSGEHETAFFWTDETTGEPLKCRVDCLSETDDELVVVDFKSTTDASTDAFTRSILNLGYDLQAAYYSTGVKICTGKPVKFLLVPIEKEPPYAYNIIELDPAFVTRGEDIMRDGLKQYHKCKTSGNWYGYTGEENKINMAFMPAWA